MIDTELLAHPIDKTILSIKLRDVVKHGTFTMYFPYQWAPDGDGLYGPPPEDPLTIYACLDATDGGDLITIKTTVRDLLIDTHDLVVNIHDGTLNEEAKKQFQDLRAALMNEVAWIDNLLEPNK